MSTTSIRLHLASAFLGFSTALAGQVPVVEPPTQDQTGPSGTLQDDENEIVSITILNLRALEVDLAEADEMVDRLFSLTTELQQTAAASFQRDPDAPPAPGAERPVVGARIGLGMVVEHLEGLAVRTTNLRSDVEVHVIPAHTKILRRIESRIRIEEDPEQRAAYEELLDETVIQQENFAQQLLWLDRNITGLNEVIRQLRGQMTFLEIMRDLIRVGNNVLDKLGEFNSKLETAIADLRALMTDR